MATAPTVLKNLVNSNKMVIENIDLVTDEVTKWGETFQCQHLDLDVRPRRWEQCLCPICHNKCSIYDHAAKQPVHWRATNLGGVPVYLWYQPCRINCPDHGVLTEYIPWSDGIYSRFTREFNDEVAWMVTRMSKSSIALYLSIDWHTVGNCVRASHNRIEPCIENRLDGVTRICVDETSYKRGYKYITVVYNMDKNNAIWVADGHGRGVFEKFCMELTEEQRQNIQIVAGDGAKWIDSCTKDYFVNAERCVDPFHVTEWANEALNEARSEVAKKALREVKELEKKFSEQNKENESNLTNEGEEDRDPITINSEVSSSEIIISSMDSDNNQNKKKEEDNTSKNQSKKRNEKVTYTPEQLSELEEAKKKYKAVKGARYSLGKNPENRTESQTERLKLIEATHKDLYKAYEMKESLRTILHMENADAAAIELDEWIQIASESNLNSFRELSKKVQRNKDGIVNSIRHHANSAKSESCNAMIKSLIYTAHGFRNFNNMASLIYLKCSNLVTPLFNRPQMSAQKHAEYREHARLQRCQRQELLRNQNNF